MARTALLVGIRRYDHPQLSDLDACVADARAMHDRLHRHEDGNPNYRCDLVTDADGSRVDRTRAGLRRRIQKLFSGDDDVLFYFSGHGAPALTGGSLCTVDGEPDDWGIPMDEVMRIANTSRARDVVIIIDCCHGGDMGNASSLGATALPQIGEPPLAVMRDNVTVLAASRPHELAYEDAGHGIFTAAVLDALDGGAADHTGFVTPGAVYAYAERRFGAWGEQRPVYKTHASRVAALRECAPLIERLKLRKLVDFFPAADFRLTLDPEYEPEDEHGNVREPVNMAKVAAAALLKDYRDAGLLKPSTPGEQLFWTARRGHTVELTARGREYWGLVTAGRL